MAHARRPNVLLVEDNEEISENLAEIFELEGLACRRAINADAALELLGAEPEVPDAILLDLRMPGMPVERFVTALKARPAWRAIPVVLVTAALATEIPEDLAVDEVVFKPFQLDELLELIRDVVARRGDGREAAS